MKVLLQQQQQAFQEIFKHQNESFLSKYNLQLMAKQINSEERMEGKTRSSFSKQIC